MPEIMKPSSPAKDGPNQSKWAIIEKVNHKYDANEEARVNQARQQIEAGIYGEEEASSPSTLRKLGRLALDRLGIRFKKIEEKRDKEARFIARLKQQEESEQLLQKLEEEERIEEERRSEQQKIDAAKTAAYEKVKKENDDKETIKQFLYQAEVLRRMKESRLQKDRVQELQEREFNNSLTSLEEIEAASQSEKSGVEKHNIEYGDKNLEVYDLKGYPICFLQHTVDYKMYHGGKETVAAANIDIAKKLVEDPSFWMRSKEEVMSKTDNGSNTLSLSFVDPDMRLDSGVDSFLGLTYGFDQIPPHTFLKMSNNDGATPSRLLDETNHRQLDVKDLFHFGEEGKKAYQGYNEIAIRRFDEDGKPIPPSFLVTYDGKITDYTKKHASYFGVPIINISTNAYKKSSNNEITTGQA